jgi:N-acetylglucosaminyldiphosphoundecaprenol N-acetyl-beta-D-mannosaminyltransferase
MQNAAPRSGAPVLGAFIDALSWDEAVSRLVSWGERRTSRYVCICNVHSVVTGARDEAFRRILNRADMATPDGMPLAWSLRRLGFKGQLRINGPDLMWKYLAEAERLGQVVYFYGSVEATLAKLREVLHGAFPHLRIGGMKAPPFRRLSPAEDQADVDRINASGAAVVFVGLGCPKQEIWMAAHRGRIKAVTVGVGAAFDYHAGIIRRAPLWMQQNGLEWSYRLMMEPRRLWKRYAVSNSLFIADVVKRMAGK